MPTDLHHLRRPPGAVRRGPRRPALARPRRHGGATMSGDEHDQVAAIDLDALTADQRDGLACINCGRSGGAMHPVLTPDNPQSTWCSSTSTAVSAALHRAVHHRAARAARGGRRACRGRARPGRARRQLVRTRRAGHSSRPRGRAEERGPPAACRQTMSARSLRAGVSSFAALGGRRPPLEKVV